MRWLKRAICTSSVFNLNGMYVCVFGIRMKMAIPFVWTAILCGYSGWSLARYIHSSCLFVCVFYVFLFLMQNAYKFACPPQKYCYYLFMVIYLVRNNDTSEKKTKTFTFNLHVHFSGVRITRASVIQMRHCVRCANAGPIFTVWEWFVCVCFFSGLSFFLSLKSRFSSKNRPISCGLGQFSFICVAERLKRYIFHLCVIFISSVKNCIQFDKEKSKSLEWSCDVYSRAQFMIHAICWNMISFLNAHKIYYKIAIALNVSILLMKFCYTVQNA